MVAGDALRLLFRNRWQKIPANVDGGLTGGSGVHRPGSEDPHRHERKFVTKIGPKWVLNVQKIFRKYSHLSPSEKTIPVCCVSSTFSHILRTIPHCTFEVSEKLQFLLFSLVQVQVQIQSLWTKAEH